MGKEDLVHLQDPDSEFPKVYCRNLKNATLTLDFWKVDCLKCIIKHEKARHEKAKGETNEE